MNMARWYISLSVHKPPYWFISMNGAGSTVRAAENRKRIKYANLSQCRFCRFAVEIPDLWESQAKLRSYQVFYLPSWNLRWPEGRQVLPKGEKLPAASRARYPRGRTLKFFTYIILFSIFFHVHIFFISIIYYIAIYLLTW